MNCDFYNVFQRQCKKTEYSDGFPLERFYLSCLYYGQESRCFSSGVNNVASCQNASCSEDGKKITITINQTTKVCEKPGNIWLN